jgi:hypothetical protein
MPELVAFAAHIIALAADPILLLGCLVVARLASSRGQAALGGAGIGLAAEALMTMMTINDPFGEPYPFGRLLVLRCLIAAGISVLLHMLAQAIRRRRAR